MSQPVEDRQLRVIFPDTHARSHAAAGSVGAAAASEVQVDEALPGDREVLLEHARRRREQLAMQEVRWRTPAADVVLLPPNHHQCCITTTGPTLRHHRAARSSNHAL